MTREDFIEYLSNNGYVEEGDTFFNQTKRYVLKQDFAILQMCIATNTSFSWEGTNKYHYSDMEMSPDGTLMITIPQ